MNESMCVCQRDREKERGGEREIALVRFGKQGKDIYERKCTGSQMNTSQVNYLDQTPLLNAALLNESRLIRISFRFT